MERKISQSVTPGSIEHPRHSVGGNRIQKLKK